MVPIVYGGAYLIAYGLADLLYSNFNSDGTPASRFTGHSDYASLGVLELALGFLLILGLGGLVFMKSLSDVVEDGMVEF